STQNTFPWTPTSANANYRVGVWVKSDGNGDTFDRPQSTGSVPFGIDTSDLTLTSLMPDKTAPQVVGTTVTFTALATGGVGPLQYRWWVFDGAAWSVAREWSVANTFAWTPATPNSNYRVGVWVKSASTPGDTFDRPQSTSSVAFAIDSSNLTLTGITPDKTAPQGAGTTVTFTATAIGGVAPLQYKWFVFDGAS